MLGEEDWDGSVFRVNSKVFSGVGGHDSVHSTSTLAKYVFMDLALCRIYGQYHDETGLALLAPVEGNFNATA